MVHDIDVILFSVFFFMTKKQQNGIQIVNHSVNKQQNGTYIMHHSVFKLTEWHPFCLSLLYPHVNEWLSYSEDPGLWDKPVDEGGECILQ